MEYLLDFTKFVPFAHAPSYQKATSCYVQTVPQAPMAIEFRQQRTGVFIITVCSEKDARKLEISKVLYSFGKNNKGVEVPFTKMKARQFYENPKWVNIDRLYNSSLKFATNEQIDDIFKEYGEIIVPCHEEKENHGFTTGRKKIRLDLKKDIERWTELEIRVTTDDNEIKDVKGRVRVQYPGQPYMCNTCDEIHDKRCPETIRRELEEKESEKKRLEEATTLMVGDSNMRRVNEKAFKMTTDCATGAKIGHIANALSFYEANEKTNEVIVLAGQNNVVHEDIELGAWEKQMKNEVGHLKKQLKRFKKSIVIGVPPAPWCRRTEASKEMRTKINKALKDLTRDLINSQYVIAEDYCPSFPEKDLDEMLWEDERHMTETMTAYTMTKVEEAMSIFQIDDFRIVGPHITSKRKYGAVLPTYYIGCEQCTEIGHSESSCKNKKRQLSTGSTTDSAKKQRN